MRIVAGSAGGRQLVTPEGDDVRPTKDRVREAVFNSLHSHGLVAEATYLDLFAGSGALGLEALSRGAAHCTFVDSDRRSIAVVADNLETLGFEDQATVRQMDALAFSSTDQRFDVSLLDPPYAFDQWSELLAAVPSDVVVIESDRSIEPGEPWEILKEKKYAGSVVVIARRSATPAGNEGAP